MPATYWTPPHPNGYWPRLSPDGRYLAYGNVENWIVHLAAGVITKLAEDGQSLGFIQATTLYHSMRTPDGVPVLWAIETPSLVRTPITQSSEQPPVSVFGQDSSGASNGHWGTVWGGKYTVDGVPFVPSRQPAQGFGIDGEWVTYQTNKDGRALPVVESILTREFRIIEADGVNHARVFSGPGGGYLFFSGVDGKPYINLPDNTTVLAALPNCAYGEGFGALAWRGNELWVWTYSTDTGECLALGRPYGAADCIQLTGIAANDKTMQVAQGGNGWTVAGMGSLTNPGYLGCWIDVPYDTVRVPFGGSHLDGTVPPPIEPPVVIPPQPPSHTIYTFDVPADATEIVLKLKGRP